MSELTTHADHKASLGARIVEFPQAKRSRPTGKPLPDSGVVRASEVSEARSRKRVEQAVANLNDFVQSMSRDLRFAVDGASGKTVVSVIDSQTAEVIRQIPSEVALRLARNLIRAQESAGMRHPRAADATTTGLVDTRA